MYSALLLALLSQVAHAADTRSHVIPVVGKWTKLQHPYPLRVFEAAGGMLGNATHGHEFVVMGGFYKFPGVTHKVNALRFGKDTKLAERWAPRAAMPEPLTHMAQALDAGRFFYGVGGYHGSHPGRSSNSAWRYDAILNKWTRLPWLPGRRAGGGLVLVRNRWLIFASGVDRPFRSMRAHYDKPDTFRLDLQNLKQGWTNERAPVRRARNHMGAVASCGRYFFLGGQKGSNEANGNIADVDEYDFDMRKWRSVAPLPVARGHISASVLAYRCGVLVVGGTGQGHQHLKDVLWWDSRTNKWHEIGQFPKGVATPVCGIFGDRLTCSTGQTWMEDEVYTTVLDSKLIS